MLQPKTWLSIADVSDLLGLTKRMIQLNTQNGLYEFRQIKGKGRGGKQIQILLDSLPKEAQERYYNKSKEYTPILHYTQKQRQEADFKATIVKQYQVSRMKPSEFIEQFNQDNETNIILTRNKLFNWQKALKQSNGDVGCLIDHRGEAGRGKSSIDDDVWQFFYSLYMTEQRRTVKRCYDLTIQNFNDRQNPTVKTFERRVKTIPEFAITRYRYGQKAFNDSLSYMERDYTVINSNDIWFSDHHLADVFVRDKKGNIFRPWITMWTDARSRMTMSYHVRKESPNTDIVKETLRDAIYDNGVPNELYVDNGKDYKAKDGLSNDYPLSLTNRLGINTIYATPYHGQAKSIERFFGTLEDRFGKMFNTYAGKDAKNRPESLKEVPLEEYPTLEEYIERLGNYLEEYHNTSHRGQGMDNKSPKEVYYEELKIKRTIEDKDALVLLCGRVDERKVHRNGIRLFDNSYWHEDLINYFGQKVVIIYDPKNIEELNAFDTTGRSICKAYPKIKTMFRGTSSEEYRKAKKEQSAIKKAVKELAPKRDLDTWQLIAQNKMLDKQDYEKMAVNSISIITPELAGNIKSLNESKKRINKVDEELLDITGSIMSFYSNANVQKGSW